MNDMEKFSMNISDVVRDPRFREFLQNHIDKYRSKHYSPDGTRMKNLKRTPFDTLVDLNLLDVDSLSAIGLQMRLGQKVDLSSTVRDAAYLMFYAAVQEVLHLRHKEAEQSGQEE